MNIYLVTRPDDDGSYLACCRSSSDLVKVPHDAIVYLIGIAHPDTPVGILAVVCDVWAGVGANCKAVTPGK